MSKPLWTNCLKVLASVLDCLDTWNRNDATLCLLCFQICSLVRGSIAERSGVRIGHRIIDINGTSTVGMQHCDVVHLLSSTVGDVCLWVVRVTRVRRGGFG